MKFLVAVDIHGDIESVKNLAKKAVDANVDAIILSGDFTFFDYLTTGTFGELKNTGKKIFVIPGNHEAQATIDFSVENTLKKILKVCKNDGTTFLDLDAATIGSLSYDVFGLGGFKNPANIISGFRENGKPTMIETGVNDNLLAKVGAGLRKLYLTTNTK